MKITLILAAALLAGCASPKYQWMKDGSTAQDFHQDRGQCMQAMFSTPLIGAMQQQAIYASCMQGKGWYSVEVPAK